MGWGCDRTGDGLIESSEQLFRLLHHRKKTRYFHCSRNIQVEMAQTHNPKRRLANLSIDELYAETGAVVTLSGIREL